MNDKEMITDSELLERIHEQDEEALQIIFDRYRPLIYKIAKKYMFTVKKFGLEMNDLIQEGNIGLQQATIRYQNNKGTKFRTFAHLCIDRNIKTALRTAGRKKHNLINESLSLNTTYYYETPLADYISDKTVPNPLEVVLLREDFHEKYAKIKKVLTKYEKVVFDYKIKGYNYREISKELNVPLKSVDNTLQRIRKKVSLVLK